MSRSHKCRGWTRRSRWSCARRPGRWRDLAARSRQTHNCARGPHRGGAADARPCAACSTWRLAPARQVVMLLSLMTALSLVLGAIGNYGVIDHYAVEAPTGLGDSRGPWTSRRARHLLWVGHGVLPVMPDRCRGRGDTHAAALVISSLWCGRNRPHRVLVTEGAALLAVGRPSQPFFRRGAQGWPTLSHGPA